MSQNSVAQLVNLIIEEVSPNETQVSIAKRAGVSGSYLSDVRRGRTIPSLGTLDRIGVALGHRLHIALTQPDEHLVSCNETEAQLISALRERNFARFMFLATHELMKAKDADVE